MGKFSKDRRDIYYRKAKEEGFRARSAFKLMQIDDTLNILEGIKNAVDLCAAPGSWSQVLAKRMDLPADDRKLVSIDLQEMAPIKGVKTIVGDITSKVTVQQILQNLGNEKADIVTCDGAPDVTGLHEIDQYIQNELIYAALNISTFILKPGTGCFVAKIFRGKDTPVVCHELKKFFKELVIAKPKCCRNTSVEAFVVCKGFLVPENFTPTIGEPYVCSSAGNRDFFPTFVPCGDLSGFDADKSYPLATIDGGEYKLLPPVQPPINPAYKEFVAKKKNN